MAVHTGLTEGQTNPPPPKQPSAVKAIHLRLGEQQETALQPETEYSFQMDLEPGQYISLLFEHSRMPVTLRFLDPTRQTLLEIAVEPEFSQQLFQAVTSLKGSHWLVLETAKNPNGGEGQGSVLWQTCRPATEADRLQVEHAHKAQQLFDQGVAALATHTPQTIAQAQDCFSKAIEEARLGGDLYGEGKALHLMGFTWTFLARNVAKAKPVNEESLKLRQKLKHNFSEMEAWYQSAAAFSFGGEIESALECYQKALGLAEKLNLENAQGTYLNRIGQMYGALGEPDKGRVFMNRALEIQKRLQDEKGMAGTLANLGMEERRQGHYEAAIELYKQALALYQKSDKTGTALVSHNMGVAYFQTGDLEQARLCFERELEISRKHGYTVYEAAALNELSLWYFNQSTNLDKEKGLRYLMQAGELNSKLGQFHQAGLAWVRMSILYLNQGNREKAWEFYKKAWSLREEHFKAKPIPRFDAHLLMHLQTLCRQEKNWPEAISSGKEALALTKRLGDQLGEINGLTNLAQTSEAMEKYQEALEYLEVAVQACETLRSTQRNQTTRTSLFSLLRGVYEQYHRTLVKLHAQQPAAGYGVRAFEFSEQMRARLLQEMLRDKRIELRQDVPPPLLAKVKELTRQLAAGNEKLLRWKGKEGKEEAVTALEGEILQLNRELQEVQTEIRKTSPRFAALDQPVAKSLKEIQESLAEDVVLLEYLISGPQSYVWAVTRTSLTGFELPAEATLRPLVTAYLGSVSQPAPEPRSASRSNIGTSEPKPAPPAGSSSPNSQDIARQLSLVLLRPLVDIKGKKRLLIVGDEMLNLIPFAALPLPPQNPAQPDTAQPVATLFEVTNLPSASTILQLRRISRQRPAALRAAAVIADPVFDEQDSRVLQPTKHPAPASVPPPKEAATEVALTGKPQPPPLQRVLRDVDPASQGPALPRLPFSRREATYISTLFPPNMSLLAVDFAANKTLVTSDSLNQYRFLQLSTHGLVSDEHPELSGLVLSLVNEKGEEQPGFLQLQDIFNLNLSADLVVLSACRTGLGKNIRGEGMFGMTQGFLYAGAPHVVATLWKVDDRATFEFMRYFYEALVKKQQPPGSALRSAQLALQQSKRWNAPYYWAAFQLYGDWEWSVKP
ncbi:MAG: CHAT domain-containing protein [Blastocatellia bacterium]|nr:CHAT domain-containing protein [Blastocatellia bacterium]